MCTFRFAVEPGLGSDHALQLFLNGEPWGEPQATPIWALTNVNRGQQILTVGVVDSEGETLTLSQPVTVFVQRPNMITTHRGGR